MEFFFLRQDLFGDATGIEIEGHTELSAQFDWLDGKAFARPYPCETLWLDEAYGTNEPDFFDTTVPVMSKQLVDGLLASGVTNLERYPVVLEVRSTGATRADYSAVNVVGRVDAVDLSQSPHTLRRSKPKFSGPIVIDAAKTAGLLAFRLQYVPGLIVVTESVARRIDALGLDSVLLQPTREYQGT
jgi:hypothetical protein